MLHHWGSHCLTYLDKLDWPLAAELALRSMIPIKVDGSQSEKVVPVHPKLKEKASLLGDQ
jgi:hypothetical protein